MEKSNKLTFNMITVSQYLEGNKAKMSHIVMLLFSDEYLII